MTHAKSKLLSLVLSASLLGAGAATVFEAHPALAGKASAHSKKKVTQKNRQSNDNDTDQKAGNGGNGGKVQCIGIGSNVGTGGAGGLAAATQVNTAALVAAILNPTNIAFSAGGAGGCNAGGGGNGGSNSNSTTQTNNATNTSTQVDVNSGNAVGADQE